jgi:WD40 repeat protein
MGFAPKIADFGLAKRIGDTLGTQTGQLMGTPGYMSPEQLAGRGGATSPGVDVYALGCVLYEVLTGRPPFLDVSIEALAARVRLEEPVPPRRLQARCPRDLETICLRCLEKVPTRRYPSAAVLAEDLARFLAGEPILARPPSALDRWRKLAWRNRALVGGVAGVIAALALGIATTAAMALRESRARQLADANAHDAEAARTAAIHEAYQARLAAATAALGHHDIRETARQLEKAPAALRGWEWRHLRGRLDQALAVVAGSVQGGRFAFCPPGHRLAELVGDGRGFRLRDALTGEVLVVHDVDRRCRQVVAFSTRAGPRFLLDHAFGDSPSLSVLDGDGGLVGRIALPVPWAISSCAVVAMAPDGRRVAFQTEPYVDAPLFEVWDATTGKRTTAGDGYFRDQLQALTFSPDSRSIAAARGDDGHVLIFDAESGRLVTALDGHFGNIRSVAYSSNGRWLATCGDDQTIRVWDVEARRSLHTLRGHVGGVYAVAFSPDGRRLVSGGSDSTVRLWDAETGALMLVLHGHSSTVDRAAFSDDGRVIASGAVDGSARLWDASTAADTTVLRGHAYYVYPVAYSPDGRWVASGSWDRTIRVWDAAGGELVRVLKGHEEPLGALTFTRDSTRLASWAEDNTIRLWVVATGAEVAPCFGHVSMAYRDSVYSLIVTPDGRKLAAASKGEVRFWDIQTGATVAPLLLPLADARVFAFSPDGRRLAAGGNEPKVVVVDAASGALVAELAGFQGRVQSIAFSPDGRQVLTAGQDPTLRLWDVETGRLARTFTGHGLEVLAALFHPDGTRIASGGHDRSVLIWDAATGLELTRLTGHTSYIFSLAFSPDGETLVSGSGDFTLRLWDAFPVARRLRARLGQRLRAAERGR